MIGCECEFQCFKRVTAMSGQFRDTYNILFEACHISQEFGFFPR